MESSIYQQGPDAIIRARMKAVLTSRDDAADSRASTATQLLAVHRVHAPVAQAGRQGNPAQKSEPDLLPDQRRRPRSGARRGRPRRSIRLRLVLSVLPRSRAVPAARRDAARDAARGGRREGRSELRRPADAVALGPHRATTSCRARARPARRCCMRSARPKPASSTAACRRFRIASRASSRTKSPTSRSARARRAKASSGKRSTPPAPSSCRCCSWSRTTATRSRCRSKCRRRAATSRGSCDRFPACTSTRSTAPISSPACARCARPTAYVRARKGPAFVHARVIRPYSHSLSDDEKLYKPPAEREAEARRDPIARFAEFLQDERPRDRRGAGGDGRRRRARSQRGGAEGARRAEAGEEHRRAVALLARRRSVVRRVRDAGASRRQARHDGRRRSTAR